MRDLSIIIPYCNEYPQIAFTVQSVLNEFRSAKIDFELICVDNFSEKEMTAQGRKQDKGSGYIESIAKINPEMKYIKYLKKLSHWQAKNAGVSISTGKFLWFCDAHCVVYPGTVSSMFKHYKEHHEALHGTLHLPISYMLDGDGRSLIYKLTGDISKGEVHYSFTRYRHSDKLYEVPCMSTCGMMMSRRIYDELGGWPEELGIYGGGENFINFTLATLGYSVNIFPSAPLYHYAEKRGYEWNFDDHLRNKMIAAFLFSDYEFLKLFTENHRGNPIQKQKIMESVIGNASIIDHREMLIKKRVISIQDWWKTWQNTG